MKSVEKVKKLNITSDKKPDGYSCWLSYWKN